MPLRFRCINTAIMVKTMLKIPKPQIMPQVKEAGREPEGFVNDADLQPHPDTEPKVGFSPI